MSTVHAAEVPAAEEIVVEAAVAGGDAAACVEACQETQKALEACITEKGDEAACLNLIEAHKECMIAAGVKA